VLRPSAPVRATSETVGGQAEPALGDR
jgi:hypothetical protein